jgi:hypothetical protein
VGRHPVILPNIYKILTPPRPPLRRRVVSYVYRWDWAQYRNRLNGPLIKRRITQSLSSTLAYVYLPCHQVGAVRGGQRRREDQTQAGDDERRGRSQTI